jgi:hypothetical protein
VERLRAAIEELEAQAGLDPRELSRLIDRLQVLLSRELHEGKKRGDHLLAGRTACGWVMSTCSVTGGQAAQKLCVGEQLEAMPQVADAVRSGEIGFQHAAVLCRFRSLLREDLRPVVDEGWWIGQARQSSVKDLSWLEQHTRYMLDPDSFDHQVEEDYEKRFLSVSESNGMFHLSGVLDRVAGSTLEAALDSLSKRLGEDDRRTARQRRADALDEIVRHALDKGTLPKRHGKRPHLAVHTTLEGLKRELGAAASHLESGLPISSKTVQRLACDGIVQRVLKADSMVVDVGRAKRTAQPAQWAALKAHHRSCAWPGCERPLSWTHAHHIDFWATGGKTNLRKLVPLCLFHHRLVHEGGAQIVQVGDHLEFIPPEVPVMTRRRWGEWRRAA